MIRLSDLRDPVAFLNGARVPLRRVPPDPLPDWCSLADAQRIAAERWEWIVDAAWFAEFPDALGLVREVAWDWTALDHTDPEVARWCDRKIAERLARHSFLWAVLTCRDDVWEVIWGSDHEIGRCGVDVIAFLPLCHRANVAPARAALVRALYGEGGE